MPPASTIGLFVATTAVFLLVPGPAVMYVVTRSVSQGRRAGLVSVAGIHTGSLAHVAAAVLGLSALLATSATAFTAVKIAGAAYLVYLGVRALLDSGGDLARSASLPPRSYRRLFADGVVVNVLNPKTAVFFVAFVPQFLGPGGATSQLLVLSVVFVAIAGGIVILWLWPTEAVANWLRELVPTTAPASQPAIAE